MFDREENPRGFGHETGTFAAMLRSLGAIHAEVKNDVLMGEFAATVATAIAQLCELRRLAYLVMIEIEAEVALAQGEDLQLLAPDLA